MHAAGERGDRPLLDYISDIDLGRTIQAATNKSEAFSLFVRWVAFGGGRLLAENTQPHAGAATPQVAARPPVPRSLRRFPRRNGSKALQQVWSVQVLTHPPQVGLGIATEGILLGGPPVSRVCQHLS